VDKQELWNVQKHLGASKKRFELVENVCVKTVLMNAEVIVTTCIGAGVRSNSKLFYLLFVFDIDAHTL
jgi:hypothetical protein